jgi:TATA-box binding protein (TBP) (component of TFIID and TFIIIB)
MYNGEALDDYQISALTQKKKVTILAFPRGCVICAGCKDDPEVDKTYLRVLPMLYDVRDNEQNRLAEEELIRSGLY